MRSVSQIEALDNAETISTDEFARLVGVPPRLVREWRGKGQGPEYEKPVHLVRYRMRAVRAWLARHTHKTVES